MKLNVQNEKLKEMLAEIARSDANITIIGCCDDCSRNLTRWMAQYIFESDKKNLFVINRGSPLGIKDIYKNRNIDEFRIGYDLSFSDAVEYGKNNFFDCYILKISKDDKREVSFNEIKSNGKRIIDVQENVTSCSIDGKVNAEVTDGLDVVIYTSCADGIEEIIINDKELSKTIYSLKNGINSSIYLSTFLKEVRENG